MGESYTRMCVREKEASSGFAEMEIAFVHAFPIICLHFNMM